MEGQIVFYKQDRILYRHHIDVHEDDYAKGVNDALIAFQRNFGDFDFAGEAVQIRFKKPGEV